MKLSRQCAQLRPVGNVHGNVFSILKRIDMLLQAERLYLGDSTEES
jgi:hypothetical protein